MELRPEDYFIGDTGVNGECLICILEDKSDYNMILLGNSFLRGFYSTHDLSTNKFGFAAHATSNKADPREGPVIDNPLPGTTRGLLGDKKYILYICLAIAAIGTAIGLYFCLKKDGSKGKYQTIISI